MKVWCSWGFSGDLARKMVEVMRSVPVGEWGRGVCVCVLCWVKMKEKRTRMKVTRQREKRESCEICGGGGLVRWDTCGPFLKKPEPFFFFFLTSLKLESLHSFPLIKISSSKFYVPWSWKRFGYLDNITSSCSQDVSFTKWFFQNTFTQKDRKSVG